MSMIIIRRDKRRTNYWTVVYYCKSYCFRKVSLMTLGFLSTSLASLMRNYFPKLTSGAPLHTLSKLYDVPVGFVSPIWCSVLLYLRSPKGGCCSISDYLSCSDNCEAANRWRSLLLTPGPVSFGTCIYALLVETSPMNAMLRILMKLLFFLLIDDASGSGKVQPMCP